MFILENERFLDRNRAEVATAIARYVAKKLSKLSKCESCKKLLKAVDDDIFNNTYLRFFLIVYYSCDQYHLLILFVVTGL